MKIEDQRKNELFIKELNRADRMLRRHYEYIYQKLAENCNVCPVIIKITQFGQNMSQVSFIEVNSTLKSLYSQWCKSSLQSHHFRVTLYDHTCDPCLIFVICVFLYSLQCTLYFQPSVIHFCFVLLNHKLKDKCSACNFL